MGLGAGAAAGRAGPGLTGGEPRGVCPIYVSKRREQRRRRGVGVCVWMRAVPAGKQRAGLRTVLATPRHAAPRHVTSRLGSRGRGKATDLGRWCCAVGRWPASRSQPSPRLECVASAAAAGGSRARAVPRRAVPFPAVSSVVAHCGTTTPSPPHLAEPTSRSVATPTQSKHNLTLHRLPCAGQLLSALLDSLRRYNPTSPWAT